MADTETYWAAEKDSKRLVQRVEDRRSAYLARLQRSGALERMKRAFRAYYGHGTDGSGSTNKLIRSGEAGELVQVTPNQFAQLLQQTFVRIVAQRPDAKPVAKNTNFSSRAISEMADGILTDYERRIELSEREDETLFAGLLLTEGWEVQGWNPALGEAMAPNPAQPNRPVREGDVEVMTLTPMDVWYDAQATGVADASWIGFQRRFPRHRLAAQYPNSAQDIRKYKFDSKRLELDWRYTKSDTIDDEDNVWLYEVRHLPTPELPNGRLVKYLGADCVLYDSAGLEGGDLGYPYDELHAYPLRPESVIGTQQFGHSSFNDLLGLHDLIELISTISASNVNAGGLMNLWVPDAVPSLTQLTTGLNVLTGGSQPPVAIDGVKLSPEMMALMEKCEAIMRQRVAINDVAAEGQAQKGMPAQLAALLEAQTQQFHAGAAKVYQRLVMRSRTGLLRLLKRFAKSPRVAEIAGVAGDWKLQEWTAQKLDGIDRVAVEPVNPATRDFGGRMTLLQMLMDKGVMTDPKQILNFLLTGKLEATYEFDDANLARIQRDKELLRQGIDIPPVDAATGGFVDDGQVRPLPLITDTHWQDIPEALSVLASPEARYNPQVRKAVLNYVMAHLDLWQKQPPEVTTLLGGQPAMPPPPDPSMGPPMGPTGPPQPGSAAMPKDGPPVKQPAPPPNPLTGEKPPPPLQ